MPESDQMAVSVRGEARSTVPPDSAELSGVIEATGDAKAAALEGAARALDELTGELAALGGTRLDADTRRAPLTWSAHSASTSPEYADTGAGGRALTGRVVASVSVLITVRELALLGSLGDRLAAREPFTLHQVTWQVDWDNPAWAQTRAEAIRAAVGKARDYAATLGGHLSRIEHIADPGLLSARAGESWISSGGIRARAATFGDGQWPALDPVPQELTVAIEARFIARGLTLG